SSRRRHTRSKRDWSSDVCSSDLYDVEVLLPAAAKYPGKLAVLGGGGSLNALIVQSVATADSVADVQKRFRDRAEELLREGVAGRSEERRVGKVCRSRME